MTHGQGKVKVLGDSGQARMTFRGLLSIHEFAQICRTTPRTLRFYEQKGLFQPAKIDENNKYRFYDPRQARDFLKIRLLQNFHIPLKQIAGYVSLRGAKNERRSQVPYGTWRSNPHDHEIASPDNHRGRNDKDVKSHTAEEYLQNKLKTIKEEIKEKEKEYKFLEKIRSLLFEHESPLTPSLSLRERAKGEGRYFQTKSFGPYNLFCMKVEHGEYAKITDYIKTLWKEAKRLKLKCKPSEITFYFNNAYNPKNTPFEIALILRSTSKEYFGSPRGEAGHLRGAANNDFYFKTYPKTKALLYNYNGPYEYLILIYQKLFELIRYQNINLKGLVFERYTYGPLNTKSKYDYQTTIGFPI